MGVSGLMKGITGLAAAAVMLCARPSDAGACSPTWCVAGMRPIPGSTDVPLNAHIWIDAWSERTPAPGLALLDDEGREVPTARETHAGGTLGESGRDVDVLVPLAPLQARTNYRLAIGDGGYVCAPASELLFTTGDSTQHLELVYPGALRVQAELVEGYPGGVCPAVPQHARYIVEGPIDPGAAYFAVLDDDEVELGASTTRVAYIEIAGSEIESRCFIMRAVDITGRPDGNRTRACYPTARSQSTASGGDAQGCASAGISPLPTAAVLLFGRRRRR